MQPIPILTYHQVDTPPAAGAPFRSLVVAPRDFDRQMGFLRMLGYQGLSMTQLEPYLRGEKTGKVVGITLDDGYANNFTCALPILRRHGFSATCYVVSGMVGGSNAWDQQAGVAAKPLMELEDLQSWVAQGQEIGAHSRHHVDLTRTDAEQAQAEIAGSKRDLELMLGVEVRHFCYPYGHYGPQHAAMVRDAGFVTATTTRRSRSRPGTGLFELPRVPVLRSTTRPLLWLKLATGYEDRRGDR